LRDAADKRVAIHLLAQTEQVTKVSIRIGTFGAQTKGRMICNRISPGPALGPVREREAGAGRNGGT
jgi:hypothetical protein